MNKPFNLSIMRTDPIVIRIIRFSFNMLVCVFSDVFLLDFVTIISESFAQGQAEEKPAMS